MICRRAFIAAVAVAIVLAPFGAKPQQAGKVARIGFLSNVAVHAPLLAAFRQGLHERGYVEGQNIQVEYRSADGSYERLLDLAAELVRLEPDLIVAAGTPAPIALKRVTSTIPLVMTNQVDPVATGLVASLGRPGGNFTGLSFNTPEILGKQMELLKMAVPAISGMAVLSNPANPSNALLLRAAESGARSLKLQLHVVEATNPNEFVGAFSNVTKEHAGALLVLNDPMFFDERGPIVELAAKNRLPAMGGQREYAEAGSLMAYGADLRDNLRRAAVYVDKILKGAKPADLPVELPTKFQLVINLKTARALESRFRSRYCCAQTK